MDALLEAMQRDKLTSTQRVFLIVVDHFIAKNESVSLSYHSLIEKTGLSKATIASTIKSLIENDWLIVTKGNKTKKINNSYQINSDKIHLSKYVICYSGGHSSALCAIEAVRKYGKDKVILLNHDISPEVEHHDIKRFKQEIAEYLDLPITYANHVNWETATPIKVCSDLGAWKGKNSPILCTTMLKTQPFAKWLKENDPNKENTYVYGFDKTKAELNRAQRRSQIMCNLGYKTEFPLISWHRTIQSTEEINIKPPMTYAKFKHSNCFGCLKAGWQHWYIVYCEHPQLWQQAKEAEEKIGYAIHKNADSEPEYLEDKEQLFSDMKAAGIEATEHVSSGKFWNDAKAIVQAKKANIPYEQLDFLSQHDETVCLDCMA